MGDLITEFRAAVGEKDSLNSSFTNTDLRQWINEGQDYVSSQSAPLQLDTTLPIANQDSLYRFTMGDRTEFVYAVFALDDVGMIKGPIMVVPPDSFGLVERGFGTWSGFGKNLLVNATELFENDSLLVFYYGRPDHMTLDTNTCQIPQTRQQFILDYMAFRALTEKQFWSSALGWKNGIDKGLTQARALRPTLQKTE